MRIILIRHAIAVARGTPGIKDDDRPLTSEGEEKFRQAARGLARITDRPDTLLTSPLPRAARTAEIAAKAWGKIEPRTERCLADGSFEEVEAAISRIPDAATVALVGHEPHLSGILARLLGARDGAPLAFRKGGAALVELPDARMGDGTLVWFMTPKILRQLGEGRPPSK